MSSICLKLKKKNIPSSTFENNDGWNIEIFQLCSILAALISSYSKNNLYRESRFITHNMRNTWHKTMIFFFNCLFSIIKFWNLIRNFLETPFSKNRFQPCFLQFPSWEWKKNRTIWNDVNKNRSHFRSMSGLNEWQTHFPSTIC